MIGERGSCPPGGQVVQMPTEGTEARVHVFGLETGEVTEGAQPQLQEDLDQCGRLGAGVFQGGDRLGGEEVHGLPGFDPTRLPGGEDRGEDGVGDSGEELPPGVGDESRDQSLDSTGFVGVAVSERVEGDRQCSRAEQGEPGDEALKGTDPGAEMSVVCLFVPDRDVGFRTAVSHGALVVPGGDSGGTGRSIGGDHPARVEDRDRTARSDIVFDRCGHRRPVGHGEYEGAAGLIRHG